MKNKIITSEKQKELLTQMMKYIDKICRNNNIKYSLIGGTLIGAIRHHGFIPWDDDIDIILDCENYKRLVMALKEDNNKEYELFIPLEKKDYPFQFAKLINTKTVTKEEGMINDIPGYGLFVDIFCYVNVPNDLKERKAFYKQLKFLNNSLVRVPLSFKKPPLKKKVIRFCKNAINCIIGYKMFLKIDLKHINKYADNKTNYVMSNNPVYGYDKEVQKADDINEFIDVEFEGNKLMAFKHYDSILKTTFGDYMKLPPKEKRINHGLKVYWRDKKEIDKK